MSEEQEVRSERRAVPSEELPVGPRGPGGSGESPDIGPVADGGGAGTARRRGLGPGERAVVRDALGVGIAVGLSGFAFGVTSVGAGLDVAQTCALSLLVFTGASQFALVGALAAGSNPLTAAAGAFFLGARNAFYGLRLGPLLQLPRWQRPFAAHWVIDETAAVALAQPTARTARLGFTLTGLSLFLLWNLTTSGGALGAEALGDPQEWGLDAAGPAVFLALLAPMLRTTTERLVAGVGVVLALGCLPVLPSGVPILVAAAAAPLVLLLRGRRAALDLDTGGPGPAGRGPEPGTEPCGGEVRTGAQEREEPRGGEERR